MSNLTGYLPASLDLNCSEFPNSCLLHQFTIFKNMFDMFTDIRFATMI